MEQDDSKKSLWGGLHESVACLAQDGAHYVNEDPSFAHFRRLEECRTKQQVLQVLGDISENERHRLNSPLLDLLYHPDQAYKARVDHVKFLLERHMIRIGMTLVRAAEAGNRDLVASLLDQVVNQSAVEGALIRAVQAGKSEVVTLLLDRGAYVYEETLLHAADAGHKEIVKILLDRGAKINPALCKLTEDYIFELASNR